MRPAAYWTSAFLLVVALLFSVFGLAALVMTHHTPFHRVWGGFIVLIGMVCVIAGRVSPSSLWNSRWRGGARVVVGPRTTQISSVIGIAFVAGGIVYAITGKVLYLSCALIVVALYTHLLNRKIAGDQ